MRCPVDIIPVKPQYTTFFENIPAELKQLPQWVIFRFTWVEKRWTKVPFQTSGRRASSTTRKHWGTYKDIESSIRVLEAGDGIGFVFSGEDAYCGIDLDHCVDPDTKEVAPWALKWIEVFAGAYMEYSPSGTGIKIFAKAKLPFSGRKKGDIEIYDQKRFFTVTGQVYGTCPKEIPQQQDAVEQLLKEVFSTEASGDINKIAPLAGNELTAEQIRELIEKAKKSKNGAKFERLFKGEWEKGYKSQSEADAALCAILAFHSSCNEVAIDQIFRESGLYREKWERIDYRTGTIRRVIALCTQRDAAKDFTAVDDASPTECGSFPLIHIANIVEKPVEFLIKDLLIKNTVGFISAQPGTCKTWLAWDLAFSVATGSMALGYFQAQKGKVIAFNAEDDPSRITRHRLAGIARSRCLKLEDADFYLINVPSILLDEENAKKKMIETLKIHKPALIILDPFRNIHTLDEDKASDMSPLLNFLRLLNKEYGCSVLLVCHDRKPSGQGAGRRASQTRGSNALEGWRDTAIYLDDEDKSKKLVGITIYHRGAPPPEPFSFSLIVKSDFDGKIETASLARIDGATKAAMVKGKVENDIKNLLIAEGPMDRNEIVKRVRQKKQTILQAIQSLLDSGECEEISPQPGSGNKAKRIRFLEPQGTGTDMVVPVPPPIGGN